MSESISRKEMTAADYKKYAEEDQDQWVTYGPRGLVAEAKGLALADGIDLSVAMTACVESKRNYELQMIRKALYEIKANRNQSGRRGAVKCHGVDGSEGMCGV